MRISYKLFLLLLFITASCHENFDNPEQSEGSVAEIQTVHYDQKEEELDSFGFRVDALKVEDHKVQRNESLYLILQKLDFSPQQIYQITQKAEKFINPRNFKPGQNYRTYSIPSTDNPESVKRIIWQPNAIEYVVFDWTRNDSLEIYRASKVLNTERAVASGEISSSLYEAIAEEGNSPLLTYEMAEIFAWQIDFFGLRRGDSFRVLYESKYVDENFLGVGRILAAEFTHRGETYRAYRFSKDDLDGYYDEEGRSVQKALLKAPFKYNQRISSHFSHNRFHPVLKRNMPHHGVDYAAPYGAPVLSVGDGTVLEAQYRGANGNIVKIRHNSTYETAYLHLKGFAKGIHAGAKVKQGQVIGYVGNTGRSTGTHLDYRVYKNNRPVNPLTLDLPPSESIPEEYMSEFEQVRDSLDKEIKRREEPAYSLVIKT